MLVDSVCSLLLWPAEKLYELSKIALPDIRREMVKKKIKK